MDCTIATLIACFSWSNLYIDSGVTLFDAVEPYSEWRIAEIRHDWGVETIGRQVMTTAAKNPYGRIAVGYGISFKNLSLELEASHISSLATNSDRGSNGISLRARWYPFRH